MLECFHRVVALVVTCRKKLVANVYYLKTIHGLCKSKLRKLKLTHLQEIIFFEFAKALCSKTLVASFRGPQIESEKNFFSA